MTRGHVIIHTANFMQNDPALRSFFDMEASLELRSALDGMSAAGFYARKLQTEMLDALARSGGGGDAGYARLLQCGATMLAKENAFGVLLMKILTPELFVKKLPRFFERDHGGLGHCELELLEPNAGRGRVRLRGVVGYHHFAIFWLGWLAGVLGELAQSKPDVRQSGWSWADSGPDEIVYEVSWL